jgi:fatty-acyl-CoA synthase
MSYEGIGSWIHRHRLRWADKTAIISEEGQITYTDLAARIDRLANALSDRGVQRGDRVAYLGENHPAFLESLFAVTSLGAIFVPLNTRLAAPEVHFALSDSGSRMLIHDERFTATVLTATVETDVAERIVVGNVASPGQGRDAGNSYESVLLSGSDTHGEVTVAEEDAALILYTSGTTGRPKGAVLTHGNLTWNCFNVLVSYDVTSTDVALMISPMFHVAALSMGVLPALLKGGTVILEKRFEPGQTLARIQEHRVTSLSGVPTTFQMMCEHPAWPVTDLSSLRSLTCGGSPVPMRVIDAYETRGLSFSGGYGMTETSPAVSSIPAHYSRKKAGSAGLPMFFVEVRIAGPGGEALPPGTAGEIQIQGRNVMKEYWARPESTATSFTEDGWFRSGDIGYYDSDGFLFITDRLKDMIISGGENVYPAEIEQIIMEIDAVQSVAVVGIPDPMWGEVPCAFVELRPGGVLGEDFLKDYLSNRLARYKIPKKLVIVDGLPRTSSGKITKSELRTAQTATQPTTTKN